MKNFIVVMLLAVALSVAFAYGISWCFGIDFTVKYLFGYYLILASVRLAFFDVITLETVLKVVKLDVIEKDFDNKIKSIVLDTINEVYNRIKYQSKQD